MHRSSKMRQRMRSLAAVLAPCGSLTGYACVGALLVGWVIPGDVGRIIGIFCGLVLGIYPVSGWLLGAIAEDTDRERWLPSRVARLDHLAVIAFKRLVESEAPEGDETGLERFTTALGLVGRSRTDPSEVTKTVLSGLWCLSTDLDAGNRVRSELPEGLPYKKAVPFAAVLMWKRVDSACIHVAFRPDRPTWVVTLVRESEATITATAVKHESLAG